MYGFVFVCHLFEPMVLNGPIYGFVGIALLILFLVALFCFGFTCWGVSAGSAAAILQRRMKNVPGGSMFSFLQSLTMKKSTLKLIPISGMIGFALGCVWHFL